MSTTLPSISDRRTVFLSHANPADNAFTQWLALRLAREGYEVWCDLTKLIGGDDFWLDIEQAIRQKARKVIYVLSRKSNQAAGVLKEVAVASAVGKQLNDPSFIIPVKIDDLPYAEHNIEINRLNALTFTHGWQDGLSALFKTLREEQVPSVFPTGPRVVATWWNQHRLNVDLVGHTPEKHWTNWFPIASMPAGIWVWKIPPGGQPPTNVSWPAYRIGDRYLSFASAKQLTSYDSSPTGGRGLQIPLDLENEPRLEAGISRKDLRTAVRQLLRQAWARVAQEQNLPIYELSSRRQTLWFPSGSVSPNGVNFVGVDGNRSDRQLNGFKSVGPKGAKTKRFWHYGIEAQVVIYPEMMLALKSHVIFTLDGNTPEKDPAYQHRARRSQCKAWWNDRWRDLLLAAMSALAKGQTKIALPLCPRSSASIGLRPLELESPVGYCDEDVKEPAEEQIQDGDGHSENDSHDDENEEADE